MRIADLPLSRRLPLTMTLLVAGALFVSALLGGFVAHHQSVDRALVHVRELAASGQASFRGTLAEVHSDLHLLAGAPAVRAALVDLAHEYAALGPEARALLQQRYIRDNPHPTGQKQKLADAGDGSGYSRVHAALQPWLARAVADGGYYDLFLIDAQGTVVYTVFKETDFASRLDSPALAGSGLAAMFRRALAAGAGSDAVAFADYAPYAPSNGDLAAFIGVPVAGPDGSVLGVLALQLPIEKFNGVLTALQGAGVRVYAEYGATAATVADGEFEAARSTEGAAVRRVRLPVDIDGAHWRIVGEVTEASVQRPSLILAGVLAGLALASIAVAVPVARRMVRSLWAPVEALATRFDAEVGRSVEAIGAVAAEAETISGRLAHEASESGRHIARLLGRIDTVSASVGTAAAAVEEISVSIASIERATGTSEQRMGEALDRVRTAEAAIRQLLGATAEIDKVIRVIESVAAQTRLLSLNAVIESARAGEYGKGFAVVANEVKTLSHQTAEAT